MTYLLWDTCYTLCDAPIFALPTAMTSSVKERSGFMTVGTVGGSLGSCAGHCVFGSVCGK